MQSFSNFLSRKTFKLNIQWINNISFCLKVKICSEPILTVYLRVPTVLEIGAEDTHFTPSSTTA